MAFVLGPFGHPNHRKRTVTAYRTGQPLLSRQQSTVRGKLHRAEWAILGPQPNRARARRYQPGRLRRSLVLGHGGVDVSRAESDRSVVLPAADIVPHEDAADCQAAGAGSWIQGRSVGYTHEKQKKISIKMFRWTFTSNLQTASPGRAPLRGWR